MFVVQLVGREAGSIQEQPYHAATANIAAGTARAPTEAELEAANLLKPQGNGEAAPEALPEGYTTKANAHGGYDLFAPDGTQINDQPFPNLPAARSMAEAHAGAADQGPDFEALTVPQLKEYAAAHDIDLGEATKKADIIAAIKAPPTAQTQKVDLDAMDLDGLRDYAAAQDIDLGDATEHADIVAAIKLELDTRPA